MASNAADERAAPYLRCAAINYIGFRAFHDPENRERYRTAFDLHTKWASWFYPNDSAKYKADSGTTLAALESDLVSKRMSAQQLSSEAASCVQLQTRTAVAFMECLKSRLPSTEEKEFCVKRSVGL